MMYTDVFFLNFLLLDMLLELYSKFEYFEFGNVRTRFPIVKNQNYHCCVV